MKRIIALILSIIMLLSIAACGTTPTASPSADPTKTPEATVQPTPTPTPAPTPKPDLVLGDFTVIYPELNLGDPIDVKLAAEAFCFGAVNNAGSMIFSMDDYLNADEGYIEETHEILIGNTNRKETAEVYRDDLKYYDYIIKYVGTKLVIVGGSDEAITNAVNYCVDNLLASDMNTVEGCKALTEIDYTYERDSAVDRLYINGNYIKNYSVCTQLDSKFVDQFIADVLLYTGEKIAPSKNSANEFEILIGECDRDEYRAVADTLNDKDWAIEVENNKLVIVGKDSYFLNLAIEKFRNDYLKKETERLDITVDNDYRFVHEYPISSLTIGGKDINDFVIVTAENYQYAARRLSKLIKEATGKTVLVVTDSADNYDAAIVLSKSGDAAAAQLLAQTDDENVIVKVVGSKVYLGTNSMSYGDSPAINAFINHMVKYNTATGSAQSSSVVIASDSQLVEGIDANRDIYTITQYHGQNFVANGDGTINYWRIDENIAAGINKIDIAFSPEVNKKILEYCSEKGYSCSVGDWRITKYVNYQATEDYELPEGWEEDIKAVVNDYKDYPALVNYSICDEPGEAMFKHLGQICRLLKELDPARTPYINHFPQNDSEDNYYLKAMEQIYTDLISYDRYTLYIDNKGALYDNAETFTYNIKLARDAALKYGARYMAIVLLVDHGVYDEATGETVWGYRKLTKEELLWEGMTVLAYGGCAVSYFTYTTPGDGWGWYFNEGMLDDDGNKTDAYYNAQYVNKKLRVIGDVLVDKLSLEVFHTKCYPGTDKANEFNMFESYNTINAVTTSNDLGVTVGFFEDDLMMISNSDYTAPVTVTIDTESQLLMLDDDGNWQSLDSNSVELEAGDGRLFKIIK